MRKLSKEIKNINKKKRKRKHNKISKNKKNKIILIGQKLNQNILS